MTNNQLTDKRLAQLAKRNFCQTRGEEYTPFGDEVVSMAAELQERRKADSEPVAWTDEEELRDVERSGCGYLFTVNPVTPHADERRIIPLYRHAQPAKGLELAGWQFKSVNGDWLGLIDEHGKNQAVREGCEVREVFAMADGVNDRDRVRREHAEWSQTTFGNVGPIGPLKHLSKEALEAAAEPGDLSEWADMQFLLWDAQRRAGITDEQITQAMIEKLTVNKQREWPEPKDGEPRLHIKELPAQVVPEKATVGEMPFLGTSEGAYVRGWNDCRAAMLQESQKSAGASNNCRSGENVQDLQAGNSPVIPDAARDALEKALAAMEFMGDTLNNLDAVCSEDVEFVTPAFDAVRRVLEATPQEVQGE